jgi:hypothetical protein
MVRATLAIAGGGGEGGLDAALAGRRADTDRETGLAGSARAEGDDVLPAGVAPEVRFQRNELAAGEIEDKLPGHPRESVEVEAFQRFQGRE